MHSFVTVAVPFRNAPLDVERALDEIGNTARSEISGAGAVVREALDNAAFVHFMSITIVDGEGRAPSHLILELTADGGLLQVFEGIATAIGPSLRAVLAAAGVEVADADLADFLRRHHRPVGQGWFSTPGLNFDGTPGMTVARIRREAELAATIARMLDDAPPSDSALAALTQVRQKLWAEDAQKWAFVPEPTPILGGTPSPGSAVLPVLASAIVTLLWPLLLAAAAAFLLAWWAGGLASGIGVAVLLAIAATVLRPRWPFLAAAAASLAMGWFAGGFLTALWTASAVLLAEFGGAYALLRRKERSDATDDTPPSAAAVEEIMRRENFGAQNHLAATSPIKPGRFRRLTLRLGLWTAGQLAAHFSAPGALVTTRVIHFARWILLPGTDQLLFRSNFDGTWERYLEDFIELAYLGVNGIWSNTVGFPKTRNLFSGGARDGDRLRRWTRRQQYPTLAWYSAYPQLTLARIQTNAAIRQGVASAVTEAEASDWLACFGSAPRPAGILETSEIPTLVFGGLRRLLYGTCILIRLSADRAKTKAWLSQIEDEISYGNQLAAPSALLAGFSHGGIEKLGIDIGTFPVAFQQGSEASWRARALADNGDNAPDRWQWGRPGIATDAVLLVYARDQGLLRERVAQRLSEIAAAGHCVVRRIDFAPLPEDRSEPVREPFGFIDGVSNPVIRGIGRWMLPEHRHQLVAPGEFVLGYPDNLGYIPSSPSVAAGDDPTQILPALSPDLSRPRPDFSMPQPTGRKDLGCNGTFLVVRQLEQDDTGFEAFLDEAARALAGNPKAPSGDRAMIKAWIAAKMVGRWRLDGSSLVRHPHPRNLAAAPAAQPDNEFLYGIEDPNGQRCPFGAHIRRANPRESLTPADPDAALTLTAIQAGANPFDRLSPAAQLQLAITARHRIMRVGRSYLPQDGLDKPGLVFMCLNTDIERQFEFVQKTWVFGSSFHGLEAEVDPLVGPRGGTDLLTIPTASGPLRLKGLKDFVTVRGSGYFFLPGRKAMRFLAR